MTHIPDLNSLGKLKVEIPFNLLAFIISVSFLLILSHFLIKSETWRDSFTFSAAVLSAAGTVIGAYYAYQSIKQALKISAANAKQGLLTKEEKIIDRTIHYIHLWNDPQYAALREAMRKICDVIRAEPPETQDKFVFDYFESHPHEEQQVITVFNFLTEIAIYIEAGYINEELAWQFYDTIIKEYCEYFAAFISQRRNRGGNNKNKYQVLLDLHKKWHTLQRM
ncbi:MAG: DUF4760 domain-containing protein [Symploca sp. SIO2E9]|nr:DUF4760 domain-containing protein [Symploca sp. SIO2E9]